MTLVPRTFTTVPLLLCAIGCGGGDLGPGGTEDGPSAPGGGTASGGGGVSSSSGGSGGSPDVTATGGSAAVKCNSTAESLVTRAPLRRLTRFEYGKTIASLLGFEGDAGSSLPPELLGNGFGNDAEAQPVSSFLAEQYGIIAANLAEQAVADSATMARFAPCWTSVSEANQASCTTTFVENFLSQAFRRPIEAEDLEDYLALRAEVEELTDYQTSIASVIETALQSPDFLYRVEFGEGDESTTRKPTGFEMATRLSYFFWGSPPDDELRTAAEDGTLSTAEGVLAQATRLLDDQRSREVLRFFFGRFLPINGLTDLARDEEQYPDFNSQIGALMSTETRTFLEYEIFEGPGDWRSALTAPYTFVNETLAEYYGIPGVTGDEFQKVMTDPAQRKGLLTQGSILTGTTVSNFTNPVRRGVFLLRNIMCVELKEPPESLAEMIVPPDPYTGSTGRERYSAHSQNRTCAGCHAIMDPPGFALENYDAVGQWRDQENGVTIDASGELLELGAPFSGPTEMVELIANAEATQSCFAQKWLAFASGRSLSEEDECLVEQLSHRFQEANYQVKQLLLDIVQSDSFLYLPPLEVQ